MCGTKKCKKLTEKHGTSIEQRENPTGIEPMTFRKPGGHSSSYRTHMWQVSCILLSGWSTCPVFGKARVRFLKGLRFFLCPKLVSFWSVHFSHFITELKIHHLYSLITHRCVTRRLASLFLKSLWGKFKSAFKTATRISSNEWPAQLRTLRNGIQAARSPTATHNPRIIHGQAVNRNCEIHKHKLIVASLYFAKQLNCSTFNKPKKKMLWRKTATSQ